MIAGAALVSLHLREKAVQPFAVAHVDLLPVVLAIVLCHGRLLTAHAKAVAHPSQLRFPLSGKVGSVGEFVVDHFQLFFLVTGLLFCSSSRPFTCRTKQQKRFSLKKTDGG
jgi:hypothetical protein